MTHPEPTMAALTPTAVLTLPQRRRMPGWLRDWVNPQPSNTVVVDAVTALLVMLTVGFPFMVRPDWSHTFSWESLAVWVPFTAAIAIRRVSPWGGLIFVAIGVLVKYMLGLPLHGMDVAVPIVLFASAARGSTLLFGLSGVCAVAWPLIQAVYSAVFVMDLPLLDRITGRANLGPMEMLLPIGVIGVPLVLVNVIAWGAGGLLRMQLTSHRIQLAAELAELEYQQTQVELVREQERNYIARDMHDIVAHSLAVIVAQADGGRYLMKSSPSSVGPVLNTISETARDALVDVRGLLGRLRHSQNDAVQKTLEDLPAVYERVRQAGMNLQTVTSGTPQPLSKSGEVAVFRMVQECLTNALKYGSLEQPTTVRMDWGSDLAIQIQNTVIATREPVVGGTGHGLIGMRERLLVVGGELRHHLQQLPTGNVWVVEARIPLQADSATSADPGLPHRSNFA